MLHNRITIGLAPCRRWRNAKKTVNFNPEVALEVKNRIVAAIRARFETEHVRFVDLEFLNDEGMMSDVAEAPVIAKHFHDAGVDGVFIINCNFGPEEAAGMVGKLVGKPVLLWGPRDDIEEDGFRHTDSQCGLFAIGKQLNRHHVPFTYLENCRPEAPAFATGLRRFFAVARMVKNFQGMRVAQIGNRPKAFYSVIYNEGELLERFGIEVIPINAAQAGADLQAIYQKAEYREQGIAELKERYDVGELDDDTLWRIATFRQFFRDVAEKNDCRVIATECTSVMQIAIGAMPCSTISLLAGEGLIVACEADVLGAVSMGLLAAAAGPGNAPLLGEFTMRHPQDDNTELLWHCGAFPYCHVKEGCRPRIRPNTRNEMQLREGEYTLCRLDAAEGRYSLLAGTCRGVDGPYTYGAYLWANFDDLGRWERRLVEGPYIHHVAEIPGDYVEELREFCRYFPGIALDNP